MRARSVLRRGARLVATLALGCGTVVLAGVEAGAATFTVDTTVDVVNGGDGLTSLREAFAQASANVVDDTIVLAPAATYQLTSCVAGALTHAAAEALTVQGNGATIEQTCPDTGVIASTDIAATSLLTLSNLTIDGGTNTGTTLDGGAVFADGRLVLSGVTISGVEAGPGGTIVDSAFEPGPDPTVLIMDSAITGNQGTAVSGDFVSVTVETSTIAENVGSGVSLVDGTPLSITESTITGNTGRGASTTGQGHTRMQVIESTISDNGRDGISCSACASLVVEDATVNGNGATATAGTGGGIAFTYDYDPVPTMPGVTILSSIVSGNHAQRAGGGISVGFVQPAEDPMAEPVVHIADSTVAGNETVGDDVPGGGIALRTSSAIIERTTIADNDAGVGGVVSSRGGGLYMAEPVGDGIADGRDLILNDTTVTGNDASGSGGGAFIALDGRMESADVSFELNSSGGTGGGLHLAATDASIDIARFTGNSALRGGGLAGDNVGAGGEIRVSGATFSANSATDHGGGLTADDLELLQLTNSTVTGNSAPEGGGLSVGIDPMDDPETIALHSTTVADNTAATGANVIAYEGTLRTEAAMIVNGIGGAGCAVAPGNLDALGHSFVDDAACAGAATDVVSSADPLLGPLSDNGGPTPTRLPAAISPIGGLIPAGLCPVATDQRGVARPQGMGCEPGSVEIAEAAPLNPITGTNGPDLLLGTSAGDLIRGLLGVDLLLGLEGDDTLEGGPGNDVLTGGPGADTLRGGPGADLLMGDEGDLLDGGPGRDLCIRAGRLPYSC